MRRSIQCLHLSLLLSQLEIRLVCIGKLKRKCP
uniref:Uncharacterized protein n=1 Tax=Anguilla anguilla TaxID=7936 RepID=A0A0E9PJT2_ANGAN